MSIYDIEVALENGETYKLERYKGKTLLIVNTATKCGLAPQFEELQTLYENNKEKDFVILGFPTNQFKQEVDSASEAAQSCRTTYGVSFPMHEMVQVNGSDAHPLFQLLTKETKGIAGKSVKWNFTKFLVDKNGEIIKRFAPTATPASFQEEVGSYL